LRGRDGVVAIDDRFPVVIEERRRHENGIPVIQRRAFVELHLAVDRRVPRNPRLQTAIGVDGHRMARDPDGIGGVHGRSHTRHQDHGNEPRAAPLPRGLPTIADGSCHARSFARRRSLAAP